MGVNVKVRPEVLDEPVNGYNSYWNAAFNYTRFVFQRQDRVISSVSNDGGFMQLNLSSPPPASSGTVTVYYQNSAGTISGTATVTSISGSDVTIDVAYLSSFSGFVNFTNVIIDWKVEVIIDKWNGSSYVPITDGVTAIFKNLPNALVPADLTEFLRPELSNDYSYTATGLNFTDPYNAIQYRVRYRENFFGATPGSYLIVQDSTGVTDVDFFAVNAALQVGDALAPNMAKYLMIDDAACDGLFLSSFDEPTFWLGYAFDLSYLTGTDADAITAIQLWYDANGTHVDSTALGTLTDTAGKIGRIGVNRGTVTSNDYSFTAIRLTESVFPFGGISETKMMRVKTACENPIALVWKNKLGGWDYWVFSKKHVKGITVGNGSIFEPYIEDLSSNFAKEIVLNKTATSVITLGAGGLDANDVNGLIGLPQSIAAYMINPDGTVISRVTVQGGTWNVFETRKSLYELQFSLILPSEYIQSE